MRTVATFDSDRFNLTEPKPCFVNEGCFGDDVARWLIEKLRTEGAEPEAEPGQEDFGWYVRFTMHGERYCAVIFNESSESWIITLERDVGLLASLMGGRHRTIRGDGVMILHRILSSASEIRNLQWHDWKLFTRGGVGSLESGTDTPEA